MKINPLHTVQTLTVRRYGEIDRTNNVGLLRKWWNPLPVGLFDSERLLNDIAAGIGTQADRGLFEERSRLILHNKILIMEALYSSLHMLLVTRPQNNQFHKPKCKGSNLLWYRDLCKEITGIEIKGLEDLKQLRRETDRFADKYAERYAKVESKGEPIPFTRFAIRIFETVEMSYQPNMVMAEFFETLENAKQKQKELEKLRAKHGRNK